MQNKIVTLGPVALTTTLTTNVWNPPTTTGGTGCGTPNTYVLLRSITVTNKTGSAATFSLWKGATGANTAGTEIRTAYSVAANSSYTIYETVRLDTADFLVGGAGTATALTIYAAAEFGIA